MLQLRRLLSPDRQVPKVSPSPALWRLGIVGWLGRFPILERRRTEFGLWWGARTPRERRLLMALAGTAAIVLLVAGLYRPLSEVRAEARADIRTYEVLAAQLKAAGPELARLKAVDRSASPAIVSSSAANFGLVLGAVEPSEAGIRVSLQDVNFTNMIQWLVELEGATTLRVLDIKIERQAAPGIVDAQIEMTS